MTILSFIKKDKQYFDIISISHLELVEYMNKRVLEQTGIDMDFVFELSSDGNIDLFTEHKFSIEEIKKLIQLEWIDEDVLDEFDEYFTINVFDLDCELSMPHNFFTFILEKTFKEDAFVLGIEDLEEYIQLNISIPI